MAHPIRPQRNANDSGVVQVTAIVPQYIKIAKIDQIFRMFSPTSRKGIGRLSLGVLHHSSLILLVCSVAYASGSLPVVFEEHCHREYAKAVAPGMVAGHACANPKRRDLRRHGTQYQSLIRVL
jgi:hypothetical protein